MEELDFIIPGEVISKKNSKRCFGGKAVSSKAHMKWEKQAMAEMQYKRVKWTGDYPVELHVFFYRKTRRIFDYSNLLESVQDMMVKAGIIFDDDFKHVIPVISGMAIDKDHPRVAVSIRMPSKLYAHGV